MLGKHLDEFIMAYLNNIIIYLDTVKEHKKHIKWVLKKLYKKNIPVHTNLIARVSQIQGHKILV